MGQLHEVLGPLDAIGQRHRRHRHPQLPNVVRPDVLERQQLEHRSDLGIDQFGGVHCQTIGSTTIGVEQCGTRFGLDVGPLTASPIRRTQE
jgi:hypothetical protein